MLKVLLAPEEFTIEHNGLTGQAVEYGEVATFSPEDSGKHYLAVCDDAEGEPEVFELTAPPRTLIRITAETEDCGELDVEDEDEEEEEGEDESDDEV